MGSLDIFKEKEIQIDSINCETVSHVIKSCKELRCEDVYNNYVGLFTIDIDHVKLCCLSVGIWQSSNRPVIIYDEVWNKDFSSKFYLIKFITYEEVQILATKCAGNPSLVSHMFSEINEHNWKELFKKTLVFVDKKYENLAPSWWPSFLLARNIPRKS